MSATPSRWPREAAPREPVATTQFLPTMPLELDAPPTSTPGRRAASVSEIWHDTHPQAGRDEEDTQPGGFDMLPPPSPAVRPSGPASAPAPVRSLDPADPLAGKFNEAVSGLQVRELDDEQLFQRLFGSGG